MASRENDAAGQDPIAADLHGHVGLTGHLVETTIPGCVSISGHPKEAGVAGCPSRDDEHPARTRTHGQLAAAGDNDSPAHPACITRPRSPLARSIAERFLAIELRLARSLMDVQYGDPVTHIYNPLDYAAEPHQEYLNRYCTSKKTILFIGMNPGPFGMAQTGVPFGEVSIVKEWLAIEGKVGRPAREHPKKPILGFDCRRKEVSGSRFWGLMRRLSVTPERFFASAFVHNVCPLVFISAKGKNLTPPDLSAADRAALTGACDRALAEACRLLGVTTVVGIGRYAAKRAREAIPVADARVTTLLHPSPANPAANRGWEAVARRQLDEMGVLGYLQDDVLDNKDATCS